MKRTRTPSQTPPPSATTPAKSPDPIALHAPGAVFPDGYGTLATELRAELERRGLLADDSSTVLELGDPTRWERVRGRRTIGFAFPESDELYPATITAMHAPDVLIAPSPWAAGVVSAATLRDVHVVPLGVDAERFAYRRRERGPLLRLLHLAPHGDDPRKGVDLAIEAFKRAFPRREDVSLTIHSALAMNAPPKGDPRIQFSVKALHRDHVPAFLHGFDALIVPSRAESFGLLPLEAMATGLPTIFTAHSGGAEYADLGLPVSARDVRAPRPRLGSWFEPSLGEIVDRLREIDRDYDDVHDRCSADARAIADRFTWARTVAAITERLEG